MFIKNLKSGVISEVRNEDVIQHCKKYSDEYAVANTAEELTGAAAPAEEPAPEDPEEVTQETEEPETEEPEESTEDTEDEDADYASMSVAELRKVAKEKGIQGYANMNKETLIEVIKAHE